MWFKLILLQKKSKIKKYYQSSKMNIARVLIVIRRNDTHKTCKDENAISHK